MRRHVSREASPAERGRAFGREQADLVRTTVGAYERLFHETRGLGREDMIRVGGAVAASLRVAEPELHAELAALADGAGVDEALLVAVNARTELLAGHGPPECSAVGVVPARSRDGTVLAQNWDWHPDVAAAVVLWTIVEPDGSWLVTMTEAGILGKIGLNSRGLGLCLNILGSAQDGGLGGIPLHLLMRAVLQRCGDLDDAAALLAAADVSASSCLNLGEPGRVASFELSPAGLRAVAPQDGVLLHTNHFLDPPAGLEDRYRRLWPDTLARLAELEDRVRRGPRRIGVEDVKAALRSHDAGDIAVCCHDPDNPRYADRQATLASVVLELGARRFELAAGPPCQEAYAPVALPH